MTDFRRDVFNADIQSKMDELRSENEQLDDSDQDSKVFCFLAADLLDTTDEDLFRYTDGPNDLGIDCYIKADNDYRIYQCKSIDLAKYPSGKVFDATPVNELDEAIDYLLNGGRKASKEIQKLRNSFSLSEEGRSLTAALVLEGSLSTSGKDRFEAIKNKYRSSDVDLRLYEEKDLYDVLHSFDSQFKPRDVELKLSIVDGGLMKMNTWFCAVVEVGSLLHGMQVYGNYLFDLNVRANLKKSSVNAAIRKTISTQKGQRQFVHLNNGLVITCNNFTYSHDNKTVTLKGAQIINGCQTMSTLWDYYFNAAAEEKEPFRENLRVFVKVINNDSSVSLDDIIVASNNQNPMNERNLKSNSPEQKNIQRSFLNTKPSLRFFYIRKDGEFESYLESDAQQPKKKAFAIAGSSRRGINRFRHVDNESLAKVWWAWIGNGPSVNSGSAKVFSPSIYPHIFKEHPSDSFWKGMASPEFSYDQELMEEQPPSSYQFLTALALSSYLEARVKPISGAALKQKHIEALVKSKKLTAHASPQEQSDALKSDIDYLNKSWLRQMTFPLTELASFILVNKYQTLDSEICKRLLDQKDIAYWLENGTDTKMINAPEMKGGLLELLFEYIEFSTRAYFATEQSAILLNTRQKMYLGRRETIVNLKRQALQINENMKIFPSQSGLKQPGLTFIEALPTL